MKSTILFPVVLSLFLIACNNTSQDQAITKEEVSQEETAPTNLTEEDQLKAAVEANPDDAAANYNLAIYYYNQGVDLIRNMSAPEEAGSDSLTFDKMMDTQQRVEGLFRKALPYAEAAHRIDSANIQAITMLSGIHFGLNDMEKSDAYKAMLGGTTQSKTHTYEAI